MTENEADVEVPPPGVGFEIVTAWLPDTISLIAGIVALSWLPDTKVEPTGLSSTLTVEAWLKPDPERVMVVFAEPTCVVGGEMLPSEGAGYESETCAELLFVESA